MRTLLVFLLCMVVADSLIGIGVARSGTHDPCDSYGDCVSSSVNYIRSNPDGSLYVGDSFSIPLSVTKGPNTTSYSVSWSFDRSVFDRSGDSFTVAGNKTGNFAVSATVTFAGFVTAGNSTQPFSSTLAGTESVTVIQLTISPYLRMVNVTDKSTGFELRNPDGTFFKGDSFCVYWSATFQFSDSRTDILVNVTGSLPAYLKETSSNYTGSAPGRQGYICYSVVETSPYDNGALSLNFNAINWEKGSIAHVVRGVPFAIVQYNPVFAVYTYTDYNSLPPTSYQKPFATLVRYDGNAPCYSYPGNANTAPFNAANSTRERAVVTDFSFSTLGFNATETSSVLPFNATGMYVPFNYSSRSPPSSRVDYGVKAAYLSSNPLAACSDDNSSPATRSTDTPVQPHLFTWASRYGKWYFSAPATQGEDTTGGPYFENYTARGVEWFNATFAAHWNNTGDAHFDTFQSTYLYEPTLYDGYLNFTAVDQHGRPDPNVHVTVEANNPSPFNVQILDQASKIFGTDPKANASLKADLYEAYNATLTLKPVRTHAGTWLFLVNQTNRATPDGSAPPPMPTLLVSVSGHGQFFSYEISVSFSVYELNASVVLDSIHIEPNGTARFQSVLAGNMLVDYVDEEKNIIATPADLNFSAQANTFPMYQPAFGSLLFPPTSEPGGFALYYPFVFGSNSTVLVNLAGGGASTSSTADGASVGTTLDVGPYSGGAQSVWVRDGNGTTGRLLYSSPLLVNVGPPAPPGFEGVQSFTWSPDRNDTFTIGILNSFGVSTPVGYYGATVHSVKGPNLDYEFLWVFLAIAAGFVLLGKAIHRKGARTSSEKGLAA
ncbi:MAG: hypothetical protein KGI38_05805 [Thaumarchaeota archaeon]|nr:hypothetical protein [Nitrososphaerota archaeon]